MHRTRRGAVTGLVALAAVLTTTLAAGSATAAGRPTATAPARNRPACTAIDAPRAMNPIPASNDCESEEGPPLGTKRATVGIAANLPAGSTTLSTTPKSFSTTDGDILAITRVNGAAVPQIAIGGNFRNVVTPDGVKHPATNFAVLNESTGAVLYAGKANSYVRAIASVAGTIYLGGDFTSFAGAGRSRAAALSPGYGLTGWNPAPGSRVRAMTADASGVYLAGDIGAVRKVSLTSGGQIWQKRTSGGGVSALLATGGAVYAGGLFETYDSATVHGLVKVSPASGSRDASFDAALRADTGEGQYGAYDGEAVIALSPGPDASRLLIGIAGHAPPGLSSNQIRVISANSGSTVWRKSLIGDCQAVGVVGGTVVGGYHRNSENKSVPYPYFAAQFEASNGTLTDWDPKITGTQSNADGGNNGVQAIYSDPSIRTIFIAGAFTKYNGVSRNKSLIAFTWS